MKLQRSLGYTRVVAPPNHTQEGVACDGARPMLQLRALGGFSLHAEGCVVALPTRKAQALVAYLACSPGRDHAREKLATLFWGERGRVQAQRSLRQALFSIRRALPRSVLPALISHAKSLRLDASLMEVDALQLEQAVQANTRAALAQVPELYVGGLLEGIEIDEPSFDEWLSAERKRLHELAVSGLVRLGQLQTESGALEHAVQTMLHVVRLEPWAEQQHRALMHLYAKHGRARAALEHYQQYAETIQRELAVTPEPETERLHRSILRGLGQPAERALSDASSERSLTADAGHEEQAAERAVAPFIGRTSELQRLAELLARASRGAPKAVAVIGDAGVGKSRLLEELAQRAAKSRATIVRGRCFESERVLPLAPWAELLQEGSGLIDAVAWAELPASYRVELSRLAPRRAAEDSLHAPPPADDILRLFSAVRSVIERVLRDGPVLLILDDVQWADELSLRLLSYVARRIPARAELLLALTVRREELPEAPFLVSTLAEIERERRLERLTLDPLSESETRALLVAQGPVTEQSTACGLDQRIWTISEGNPLVALEVFHALSREPLASELDASLPGVVREFIAARFKRQSPLSRELIGVAAAIGREFEYALLERAYGQASGELLSAVEELLAARIFELSGDGLYFAHERLREVAYAALLPERRRSLHARVGRAIEGIYAHTLRDWYGRLAIHFRQAREARSALHYLLLSAEASTQKYGLAEAISALSAANELAAELPEPECAEHQIEIALRQTYCLFYLGRAGETIASLERQQARLAQLDRPALRMRVSFWLGLSHSLLGAHKKARAYASEASALADSTGDERTAGLARGLLGYEKLFSGEYDEGIRLGLEAVQFMTRVNDGPTEVAMAWLHIGMHHLGLGDCARALDALARSEQLSEQAGATRTRSLVWAFRSMVHTYRGESERALEVGLQALAMAPDPVSSMTAVLGLSRAHIEDGRYDDALAILNNLVAALKVSNMDGPYGLALAILAEAQLYKGDTQRATALSADALRLLREADDPRMVGVALRVSAQCAAAAGRYDDARSSLAEAVAVLQAIRAHFDLAQAHMAVGTVAIMEGDVAVARGALLRAASLYRELDLKVRAERAEARATSSELEREIATAAVAPLAF